MYYVVIPNEKLKNCRSPSVGGVKVSIVAFQAIDPGSIPGRRTWCFYLLDKLRDLKT